MVLVEIAGGGNRPDKYVSRLVFSVDPVIQTAYSFFLSGNNPFPFTTTCTYKVPKATEARFIWWLLSEAALSQLSGKAGLNFLRGF